MTKSTAEWLAACQKANMTYANVVSRLRSVTQEAAIARKAKKVASRAYINAITKEKQS
jgi:hypothetical protein